MIRSVSEAVRLQTFPGNSDEPPFDVTGPAFAVEDLGKQRAGIAEAFRKGQFNFLQTVLNEAKADCPVAGKCRLELAADAGDAGPGSPYDAIFHCPKNKPKCEPVIREAAETAAEGLAQATDRVKFWIESQPKFVIKEPK